MRARYLTYILCGLTFVLVCVGGMVHSTGSSLACPDWPLCYGQVFPPMQGGVLYEHSHRLLAATVGVLTLILGVMVASHPDRRLRLWAVVGVVLVVFQGLLGGLTVLLRLPAGMSIAHLATSMIFLAWTVGMVCRLQTLKGASQKGASQSPGYLEFTLGSSGMNRTAIAWAAALVYAQVVLGAVVRYQGASLACGLEAFTCAGQLWPTTALQWLQTLHRVMALGVSAAVVAATLKPMRMARSADAQSTSQFPAQGPAQAPAQEKRLRWPRYLAVATHVILLLQLVLGVLTIKTGVHMHVVTAHLALGTLLWAAMVTFYFMLEPWGRARQPSGSSVSVLCMKVG